MADRVVNGYKRLFEVRVLHHYWLDEGSQVFDSLDEDIRNERLLRYDVRQFLSIEPTKTTEHLLNGLQCVFKQTALGFVVAIPAGIEIDDNPTFEFVVTVKQPDFFTYTALTFNKRNLHEYPINGHVFRYKENVFIFENINGTVKGSELFLSRDINVINSTSPFINALESLFQSTDSTPLLLEIADNTGSTSTLYHPLTAGTLPVFVNQNDISLIALPSGAAGAPLHGIILHQEIPDDVFAVIRITAEHPTEPLLNCISGGFALPDPPVFQIRFKNRSTIWRYRDSKNPTLPPTNIGPHPLSYYGNASSPARRKPVGNVTADVNGNQITKLVSEILI